MSKRSGKRGGLGSRSQRAEAALFRKARAGCRESLNTLMAVHDGLAQAAVRRQGLACTLSFAELLQAARMGLWHAIRGYDPARGCAFATYAWPCIVRQVWHAVKAAPCPPALRGPRAEADPEAGPPCGWPADVPGAVAPDPAETWEETCVQAALQDLLARLPYRLYRVLRARYGLDLDGQAPADYAQIGPRLGVCGERARQLHVEALLWLRQPAHSQALRSVLALHTPADYQRSAAQAQAWRRRQRPVSRRAEALHAQGA